MPFLIRSQRKRILIVSLGEKGTRDLNVYKTSSVTTTTTFSNNTENPFLKKITVILKKRFGISRTIQLNGKGPSSFAFPPAKPEQS